MKVKDIRELNNDDLKEKIRYLKKELFDLNNKRVVGVVEKPSRFRQIKRDVARILTILKEREKSNEWYSNRKKAK